MNTQNNILTAGSPERPAGSDAALVFAERLARALHRYGVPSHRLEAALASVSSRLGIEGEFFSMPTAVFASLGDGQTTRTVLIRVEPGEVNLRKLSQLDRLIESVGRGRLSPGEALGQLESIARSPGAYGNWATVAAFSLASAAAARFFGGGWREFVVCGAIGMVTGALAVAASRFRRFRLFEPLAAFFAGVAACAAAEFLEPTSVWVATCAGLIVLIPGLTITIGISELATRHLASGAVRLMGALLHFLQIGFGVAIGLKAGASWFGAPALVEPAGLPSWSTAVALVLAAAAFTVLFQADRRDAVWIAAASAVAFVGARVGALHLGMEMGAFVGAALVGIVSNAHSRAFDRPVTLTLVPGIMLLVPGSTGFRGLSELLASDVVSGLQTAFTMGITAVALVSGLLLANALVAPRKSI